MTTHLLNRLAPTSSHIRWDEKKRDWTSIPEPLNEGLLQQHLDGNAVVGVVPAVEGVAYEGILDFDLHLDREPTSDEVADVEKYAMRKLRELRNQGVDAALLRHHPYGSYHLRFFVSPLAADRLGRWLRWFVADAGGIHTDTFPNSSGNSNAVRLPGRHHRHPEFWTEVWDGEAWKAWPAAVSSLTELKINSAKLFPDPSKSKQETGDERPTPMQINASSLSMRWLSNGPLVVIVVTLP